MTANAHDDDDAGPNVDVPGWPGWDALWWDDDGPDDDLPPPGGPIRSPADALDVLLGLVGPERYGEPALWFVMVDAEGYPLPAALPVSDISMRADTDTVRGILQVLRSVLADAEPDGSVLVGLVRRAGGDRGAFESSWARSLREGADEIGVRLWGFAAIGANRARMLEW